MELLTTKRLRLRNFKPEEKNTLLSFYLDKDIGKYMYWGDIKEGDIAFMIEKSLNRSFLDQGAYIYAVSYLKSDRLVGEIYLEKKSNFFILGYALKKSCQGHGYAYEILSALLKKLDTDFPLLNVRAVVDKNNMKSKNLLYRLGFHDDMYQPDSSSFIIFSLYGPLC